MIMRQEIKVSVECPDTAFNIKIIQVYRKDNTLIAISRLNTDGTPGEAMCTREDTKWVAIDANKELNVQHYIVTKGNNLHGVNPNYTQVNNVDNIPEIAGLQALPLLNDAAAHNDEDLVRANSRAQHRCSFQ